MGSLYSNDHPWNCCGPVAGGFQTVYRAELEAVHHVISSANQPTHIVADCFSVVHKLQDILAEDVDDAPEEGDHGDLWNSIKEKIADKPRDFYEVAWVASHIDLQDADQVEQSGIFPKKHIFGNDGADQLAKQGLNFHNVDRFEHSKADDRAYIACIIQAMIAAVWEKYFEQDTEAKEGGDFSFEAQPATDDIDNF